MAILSHYTLSRGKRYPGFTRKILKLVLPMCYYTKVSTDIILDTELVGAKQLFTDRGSLIICIFTLKSWEEMKFFKLTAFNARD